ncbi:hypothetical protein Q7P37_010340 [Cladosporium fusiforme]
MGKRRNKPVGLAFVHSDPTKPGNDAKLARFIRSHVSSVQHSRRRGVQHGRADEQAISPLPPPARHSAGGRRERELPSNTHNPQYQPMRLLSARALFQDPTDECSSLLYPLKLSTRDCIIRQTAMAEIMLGENDSKNLVPTQTITHHLASMLSTNRMWRFCAMLLGAASLCSHSDHLLGSPAFLALYGRALECVHSAVRDNVSFLTDDALLGVCAFIFFESFYGSKAHYHVHLQGLTTLIALRRGTYPHVVSSKLENAITYGCTQMNKDGLAKENELLSAAWLTCAVIHTGHAWNMAERMSASTDNMRMLMRPPTRRTCVYIIDRQIKLLALLGTSQQCRLASSTFREGKPK